ncbi:MAG: hypothetical protein R6U44_05815 [Archaeoglobaceae archaeon]
MPDPNELEFSKEETKQLYELTKLYPKVKELILYSEEVDTEHSTYGQTVNELRNSMDHLMRLFAVKFGFKDENPEYSKKNLDKAFGHVYRAGYDSLDLLNVSIRERIIYELNGISSDTIYKIFPEYYREIKPNLEKISKEISDVRLDKDVAGNEVQSSNFKNFENYIQLVRNLKDSLDKTIDIKPSLIEYENKKEKESKKKERRELLIRIGLVIISVVGTALLALILSYGN